MPPNETAEEAAPETTQATAPKPTPSICRIVVYNDHGHPKPAPCPAVIRAVNADGTVDLTAFHPKGCVPHDKVKQGDAVGTWNWPVR
jgi:hypothetical protein